MILYPTETIYALGVNVFNEASFNSLFTLKGRGESKAVSCLVRDIADIRRFAVVDAVAETLIQQFLPGPLTIVLPARAGVPAHCLAPDGTLGFRISSDVTAQQIIAEYMAKHDAPLSCTSANVSGFPTGATPSEILAQFKTEASAITVVHDAGPRLSVPTTLVRVFGGQVTILRQGTISKEQIDCALADGTS